MKLKRKSGIYAYLNALGVLDSGNEQLILEARRSYWKAYKANHRKNRRANDGFKECTITFNSQEVQLIDVAAHRHGRSRARFAKEACLAYIQQKFIVPDVLAVGEIKGILRLHYTTLRQMFESAQISYRDGFELLHRMDVLEKQILNTLQTPCSVDTLILEAVGMNPKYREHIMELLKSGEYDC